MLIWDIYPDIFKVTGMSENNLIYKIWSYLNKKSFKKADNLFTISPIMADLLSSYVDRAKIKITPIWSIFQEEVRIEREKNHFIEEHNLQNKFIIQYSGNIGLTHKVELLVSIAERMKDYEDVVFQIIGRGPREHIIKNMVDEKKLSNCQFLPFQSDQDFPYSLSAAHVGVVMLDDKTGKGSVPSKSYNLMSYGIPSLYIASNDSQLYQYCEMFNHGKCFTEKQLDGAIEYLLELKNNINYYSLISENSIKASALFKRGNANKIIDIYLNQ